MEEPGRLQSMGSLRVGHDWVTSLSLFTFMHWRRKWQHTAVFLPGESQGRGSLVGCHLWGCRVGHDWSNLAAAAYLMRFNYEPKMLCWHSNAQDHSHSNKCSPLCNVSFSGCFQDLSLSLFFSSFIIMWLGMVFFGVFLLGGWASLIYKLISFTNFGNFLAQVSSNIFSAPLFILRVQWYKC